MEISDLRLWGARIAAWGAEYLSTLRSRPVRAQTNPGDIARAIASSPPEAPETFETIFADFERTVMPGITHWQHPRFFAYFPANASPPSVLAEYLTATLAAQCMLWQTSPAATELETVMIDWLRQMIGLPRGFSGVIQDSASSATLAALLTARERALGWAGNMKGLSGAPRLRVYVSEQCHSSIDKACWAAGIGQDNLVKLPASGPLISLDTGVLARAIEADIAAGHKPIAVVGLIGGTGAGATDDIEAVCNVARRHDLYVHVDAAWAGSAMICPEYRHLMKGAELADSFVFNPHKWLLTNFDCSAHFIRDPEALVKTLAIRPSFLRTHGRDGIVNFSEWSLPLGRRFRALKLWFMIRAYGVEQLRAMIRNHVAWSQELAERLAREPDFEITSAPILSLFTFRYAPAGVADLDALNERLVAAINDDGRIYLTATDFAGRRVIRFQVGQTYTTREDVALAFNVITSMARRMPIKPRPPA
ncbi:MAG: DegT/DnrJ/EryC1/StrS family aminotransferase [Rhizobiales bacterium]|nr:DegT/DnrJ/EryC1/StrS family aminotransferase [Hyphomicrobiales bacterium]